MDAGVQFIRDLMIILLTATAGGWTARRIGLSPVVGYLAAGLVIGTPQITLIEIADEERINVLSQVGLVLLMFAIGMGIRLRQLRDYGLGPIFATSLGALMVLTLGRSVGAGIGLDRTEGLFFAAMLMVSSSAIIGKILNERGMMHQKVGQMALGQTLLEDFVAVVMLAILGSVAAFGSGGEEAGIGLLASIGKLAGFIVLVILTGLVLLPRMLASVHRKGGEELHILLAAGLVFGFGFMAVMAGYSLALGAFLFGLLVAESANAHLHQLTRSFSAMRDIFAAIFFVSIGMSIDLALLPQAFDLILAGTLLAIAGRIVASTLAWMLAGESAPTAMRASFLTTPIGEFSFIIAGFGIASGTLNERFQIAAVGIAFITSLLAPLTFSAADRLIRALNLEHIDWLNRASARYRLLLSKIGSVTQSHLLWRFLQKRIWQIGRELAWTAAVVVFAQPLYSWLEGSAANRDWNWLLPLLPWFWLGILLLLLLPVVSVVRNLQAISMLIVDYYARQSKQISRHQRLWVLLLEVFGLALLILLMGNLLPWWLFDTWTLTALLAATFITMALGWNHLIRWHSHAESKIQEAFEGPTDPVENLETTGANWGLDLQEFQLPADFGRAGKSLGELQIRQQTGASLIGIERQGIQLYSLGANTHLFPGDTIYLIGTPAETRSAIDWLQDSCDSHARNEALSNAILEPLHIPEGSIVVGKQLQELRWPQSHQVHVVAARSADGEPFTPRADWQIPANVDLLLAGSHKAISALRGKC